MIKEFVCNNPYGYMLVKFFAFIGAVSCMGFLFLLGLEWHDRKGKH